MIKFFRKIRYNLIEQNKTGKYLKYAIGEIILVVIGILIALSINNWNEDKKNKAKTESLLTALTNDLKQDTLIIHERLPFIKDHFKHNETLRQRVAKPGATLDTLIHIMRHEFNPNWKEQLNYNTNAYNSLNQTGLLEQLPETLKTDIKSFYSKKSAFRDRVEKTTNDYQEKITSYVNTYTFGSTAIHDQGTLIDSLIWKNINPSHLAATFQGISNFKRILFSETKDELDFSLTNSKKLISQINNYLNND
jgi:hypothetical protein